MTILIAKKTEQLNTKFFLGPNPLSYGGYTLFLYTTGLENLDKNKVIKIYKKNIYTSRFVLSNSSTNGECIEFQFG